MTSLSLSNHSKGYSLTCREALTFIVSSPYANRHLELASKGTWGHRLVHYALGGVEKIPLIGAGVSIVERVGEAAFGACCIKKKEDKREEAELHFTVRDLKILCNGQYGLRHVTGQNLLAKEQQEGMVSGCSLNLSPDLVVGQKRSSLADKFEEDPKNACKNFEEGVDAFIKGCLIWDMNAKTGLLQPGQSKVSDFLKVVDVCCFMFTRYGGYDAPCDFDSWGRGLGRFPKQDLPANQIKPIPLVSADAYGSKKEQQEVITREAIDVVEARTVAIYRTLIIRELRSDTSPFFCTERPTITFQKRQRLFSLIERSAPAPTSTTESKKAV